MNTQDLALSIILFSALIGIFAATADFNKLENDISQLIPAEKTAPVNDTSPEFQLGSAHRHALFYVVNNGTELGFLEDRYQLAAPHVHLESNRSDIVHSHAKSVTWQDFFDTINMTVNVTNSTNMCMEVKGIENCGSVAAELNGEMVNSFDQVIRQGDKMVIVADENSSEIFERYRTKQLPRLYKPQAERGERL